MPKRKPQLCQPEACAIQTCLKERGYDEDRCRSVIEAMRKCCERVEYKSFICEGFDPERIGGGDKKPDEEERTKTTR